MSRILSIVFFTLIIFFSCKKDEAITLGGNSSSNTYSTFYFNCDTLGPMPNMGWYDTTTNESKNIRFWAINPLDNNEIVYTNYKFELLTYNILTKKHKLIDQNLVSFANVSKYGRIVYDKNDLNIYTVKFNGDSLKQITTNGNAFYPQWDYTGKYIYYRNNALNSACKIDLNGNCVDTITDGQGSLTFSKNSDNYLISSGNSIYYKNVKSNTVTFLFTDNSWIYIPILSNDDKFVYWTSNIGLQRYNIALQKRDTIIKFCENFTIIGIHISPTMDKLTASYALRKQVVKPWKLLHLDSAIEFDLRTEKWRKLNIQFN